MSERAELALRRSRLSAAKQAILAGWLSGDAARGSIPRRRDPEPAPLSFAQERLWFIEQLLPGRLAYALPTAVTLTGGPVDPVLLRRALTEILRRHEALRTRFQATGGRAVQVVDPPWTAALPQLDLSLLDVAERAARLAETVREAMGHGFNLARDRLVRASLLRIGPEEHRLLVLTHHIVSDAWSQRVLVRELAALYQAYAAGQPSPLPELPIQYADYAVWQRNQPAEAALDYWRTRLAGPPAALEMPGDRPRPPVPSHRGATHRRRLPPPLLTAIRDLANGTNTTPYMVLLAALVTLLHRYTGETDLTVGTPVAGRGHADLDGLIGFFANIVVMRVDVSGDPTFLALLQRVRAVTLGAFSHAEVPFARVVDALRLPRRLSHMALFQVQLVVQDAPPPPVPLLGDLTIDVETLDAAGAQVDLTVVLSRDTCRIDYSVDLFDDATVARLAGELEAVLAGAVVTPDRPLSALPLPDVAVAARPAVPVSGVDGLRAASVYREPETSTQRTIAAVWGDALGADRVGLDDSFFDLGGHSVQLIQVHSRLCSELGRTVDVIDVFAHPTVDALAAHVDRTADPSVPGRDRLARSRQAADERRAALARLTGGHSAGGHSGR